MYKYTTINIMYVIRSCAISNTNLDVVLQILRYSNGNTLLRKWIMILFIQFLIYVYSEACTNKNEFITSSILS